MSDSPAVLIAALSGRALAQAARRAHYQPLVADLFGDDDTREAAAASVRLPGSLRHGLPVRMLTAALAELAARRTAAGLVYGSGFEDRPRLLMALEKRYRLLGNSPATVRAVKRPASLAALCEQAEVLHPPPQSAAGSVGAWLEKRPGASGGVHVRPLAPAAPVRRGRYAQEKLVGQPISVVFVADGRQARVLGLCVEWPDPTPVQPYRYGGAARPAGIAAPLAEALAAATGRLVARSGLVGLNSADFIVDGSSFALLEINPRPGATLDLFNDPAGSVFRLHIEGCRGMLPRTLPRFAPAAAACVVYARRAVTPAARFAWPDWAADRQPAGVGVAAGAPLCTVLAEAPEAAAARALVARRSVEILARMEAP
jgi:predicted ATP-grasp superfamily ATP-dependent carboligase